MPQLLAVAADIGRQEFGGAGGRNALTQVAPVLIERERGEPRVLSLDED
jgi:hypothetical protein